MTRFRCADATTANGEGSRPHHRFCPAEFGVHHTKQTPRPRTGDSFFIPNHLWHSLPAQIVPRDPFLEPRRFVNSLAVFHYSSRSHTHPIPQPSTNIALIEAINAAHDRFKQSEPFKVHRVLRSKIGDLTTDLRTATNQNLSTSNVGTTSDLSVFVIGVTSGGKDIPSSLQHLWSGRVLELKTWRGGWTSDGEREEDLEMAKSDGKSTDEEHELSSGIHWPGRVQRKIGSWTA